MASVDTHTMFWKGQIIFCNKKNSNSTKKFSQTDIIKMLECSIYNIFVMFGGRVFQKTGDIPMGINCAPLLADFIRIFIFLNQWYKIQRTFVPLMEL